MLYPTVLMGVVTTAILINKTNSNHRCWWFNQEFSVLLNKWGTQTGIKPGLYNAAFPQHGSPNVLVDTKLRCSGFLSKSQSLGNSELPEKKSFLFLFMRIFFNTFVDFRQSCLGESSLLNGKLLQCLCQEFISHVLSLLCTYVK